MKAFELYKVLENDFIKNGLSDNWPQYKSDHFISEDFKKRSMGLLCDFASEIKKVYTAVFPSDRIIELILKKNESDILLFVHHPMVWDIRKEPQVFYKINNDLLKKLKSKKIAIYNLHTPLDNFGIYSTSVTLANSLDIIVRQSFAPYLGALCGVFGVTQLNSINKLKVKFKEVMGHKATLYNYGNANIKDNKLAVVAGGGNHLDILKEVFNEGINTFITGITAKNSHSAKAHEFAKRKKINILGGTHYSTEKFSVIAMCNYFSKLGLLSEFIEDLPVMEDL